MEKAVLCRQEDSVGVITLNRPAQYNVISQELAVAFRRDPRLL